MSYFATDGLSDYYGLQVTVDKRFSNSVSMLLAYTWSHATDDVPLEFGGGAAGPQPQDPRDIFAERASSIIAVRHRLTLRCVWALPFGKGNAFVNHGGPIEVTVPTTWGGYPYLYWLLIVIKEQTRFQFRAEAFNILNRPQFGMPNPTIGNAQAGAITGTVGNSRQLQLAFTFLVLRAAAVGVSGCFARKSMVTSPMDVRVRAAMPRTVGN